MGNSGCHFSNSSHFLSLHYLFLHLLGLTEILESNNLEIIFGPGHVHFGIGIADGDLLPVLPDNFNFCSGIHVSIKLVGQSWPVASMGECGVGFVIFWHDKFVVN